jgi:hypothetical protein
MNEWPNVGTGAGAGRKAGLERLLPLRDLRCWALTWTPSGIGQVRMSRHREIEPQADV